MNTQPKTWPYSHKFNPAQHGTAWCRNCGWETHGRAGDLYGTQCHCGEYLQFDPHSDHIRDAYFNEED